MIEAVLLNILAQGIWELGLSPFLRGGAAAESPETLDESRSRYGDAVENAVRTLGEIANQEGRSKEKITRFLSKRETRNLIASLYAFRLDEEPLGIERAGAEFVALWKRASLGDDAAGEASFNALLTASEDVVSRSLRDGLLSAHEARSNARHQAVLRQLDAMERRIRYLLEGDAPSSNEIDSFENALRREVFNRHSTITPPDFYGAPRVPIDDLYVTPHIRRSPGPDGEEADQLLVEDWLNTLEYGVVLGDPGGGKSTLAAKLCHELSSESPWTVAYERVTPVMVTLREYNVVSRDRGLSIAGYIEDLAENHYQLDVPKGAVDYLLLTGRLLVIFDGLDELLETHRRQQIRDDVESFQRRFPSARILVTSRKVGYEQAPLDQGLFQAVRLAEFTDEQVEEYAAKWFSLEKGLTEEEQKTKAQAFINESRAVPDLRVNPLLLALMCNFYLGQNYLPRHLPEVYETCARMLFETWDRSRGIDAVLPIAEHIRPAMRYLAYWIYENEALQSGVPEHALVDRAVEFLLQHRFDDEYEARSAAEAFIKFCAGRAWVFSDTGSTGGGEPLFQFTHRTFLEYFSADHLVAVSETTAELADRLAPRIAAREWPVVSQVAFQLKSKATLTASDQLINDLVSRSRYGSLRERGNYLLFGAECLAFLVPSPEVVRALSNRAIDYLVWGVQQQPPLEAASPLSEIGVALARSGSETRKTVAATAAATIVSYIEGGDETATVAAKCLNELRQGFSSPEGFLTWEEALQAAGVESLERRLLLARSDRDLALTMVAEDTVSIGELVDWHGPQAMFANRPAVLHPGALYTPIAVMMMQYTVRAFSVSKEEAERWLRVTEEAARIFCEVQPPWCPENGFYPFHFPLRHESSGPVPAEALFGASVILACYVESRARAEAAEGSGIGESVAAQIARLDNDVIEELLPIYKRRLEFPGSSKPDLTPFSFSDEQASLLERWMDHEVDFVTPSDPISEEGSEDSDKPDAGS